MASNRFEDETTIDSLKLLSQYRDICENLGGLRAIDSRPPRQLEERLARVEAELQARLWMNGRQPGGDAARERGREAAREGESERASSVLSPQSPVPNSSLPQHPAPSAQPPLAGTAEVYSDGACSGNPGPGGYGTIVRINGRAEKVLSGGKVRTTNNEMEMTGAIEGLRAAVASGARDITVFSDSEYLVKGMNDWMKGWLRNGWKTRTGHPVKNRELWEELHRLTQGRQVAWKWVAGHAGHPENERCNDLAVAAARQAAARR